MSCSPGTPYLYHLGYVRQTHAVALCLPPLSLGHNGVGISVWAQADFSFLLGYLQWASEDGEVALGTAEGRIWPTESLLTGNGG